MKTRPSYVCPLMTGAQALQKMSADFSYSLKLGKLKQKHNWNVDAYPRGYVQAFLLLYFSALSASASVSAIVIKVI